MEAGPGEGRDWRGDVMFVPITQFRAVVAPTCGCGTRQHAKTKKRRKAVALMIEHSKNFFYLSEEVEKGSGVDD